MVAIRNVRENTHMMVPAGALPVIEACIVNHNTSPFAELALRSLAATHLSSSAPARLRITVIDNHSEDGGVLALKAAAAEIGAAFYNSGWPTSSSWVNSHGDVLRAFVRERPDADYYLFVDSDVVFDTPGCVWTMLDEAVAHPDVWAIQARFRSTEQDDGADSSLDIWAGQEQRVWVGMRESTGPHDYPIAGTRKGRCHPACALVVNSEDFRRVAEIVGLSGAIIVSQDPLLAGFHDTLGLASQVMSVLRLRYILSEIAVIHFFYVSYERDPAMAAAKLEECMRHLDLLRRGTAGPVTPGRWG
jgi:hypothetical protein